MTQKKTIIGLTATGVTMLSLFGATLAFAQTGGDARVVPGVSANVTVAASTTVATPKMKQAIARADKEIDRRVAALTELKARVEIMTKVTDVFKKNLQANIDAQISGFGALKAKVDADTDAAVLTSDVKSVTDSYRVFVLLMPQARIAASADRIVLVTSMMSGVGNKLQTRIQEATTAGVDTTELQKLLADMGTKLADAQTKAQEAVNGSAPLAPDNGDKTAMAANAAALKTARASIVAAEKDLIAVRKDIDLILKGLQKAKVTATTTTQVQTQ